MNETTVRKQPRKIFSGSTLKLVAIITMLIDHATAGIYLYELYAGHLPHGLSAEQSVALYEFLRDVGRTAFPIFCFLLVEGYDHTHSKIRYLRNLALFAVISEIPFDLALIVQDAAGSFDIITILKSNFTLEIGDQNVYFTLAIGLGVIWAIDSIWAHLNPAPDESKPLQRILAVLLCACCYAGGCGLADLLKTDYSYYGITLITILFLLRKFRPLALISGYAFFGLCVYSEQWAFPGFILMLFYNGRRGFAGKKFKYFFYAFYPVHLFLIYLIRAAIM